MDAKREDRRRSRLRRWRWFGLTLGVLAVVGGITLRRPLFQGNFGVVDPGMVYRGAQPDGQLRQTLLAHRIASVLNLRGGANVDRWYVEEVRETDDLDVDLYDFPMSATHRPTRRELLMLLDLLGRCRYPLLIHCKSGSDRTGLVSALYLLSVRGDPPEEARRAFSISFGHFPLLGPERLHEPFVEYEAWLRDHRQAHTPSRFLAWVRSDYRDSQKSDRFAPLQPGPRTRVAAARRKALAQAGLAPGEPASTTNDAFAKTGAPGLVTSSTTR